MFSKLKEKIKKFFDKNYKVVYISNIAPHVICRVIFVKEDPTNEGIIYTHYIIQAKVFLVWQDISKHLSIESAMEDVKEMTEILNRKTFKSVEETSEII
jgi:hypothetical protein